MLQRGKLCLSFIFFISKVIIFLHRVVMRIQWNFTHMYMYIDVTTIVAGILQIPNSSFLERK